MVRPGLTVSDSCISAQNPSARLLKANGQDVSARAVALPPDRHAIAAGVEYDLEIPGVV